jgi:hypothetical protein
MLLWNITEIEKKGQDAVDIEVLEEANQFMRDSYLMPHPLQKEKETYLGLWKARYKTIRGKQYSVESFRMPDEEAIWLQGET